MVATRLAEPASRFEEAPCWETYQVRLAAYEGPLDLLLYLVRRNEVDVYEVPIAQITDQYLEYILLMGMLNIEVSGEFIVVAAQLLLIKSRRLLPLADEDETAEGEEPEEGEDPRRELERRLAEYRRYKESAEELRQRIELQSKRFARAWDEAETFATESVGVESVSIFDIVSVFKEVLSTARPEQPTVIQRQGLTVGRRMQELEALVARAVDGLSFRDAVPPNPTRIEVVVTFLAILELVRRRRVAVQQHRLMGEIRIFALARPRAAEV